MSRLKQRLAEKLPPLEEIPFEGEPPMIKLPSGNALLMFPDKNSSWNIVPEFAITLQEAKDRIRMLREFVKEMMVSGVDYGNIPGTNKPTLLKPGAEKLCDIFGFSKTVEVLNRVEDWQDGFMHYEVKVTLINKRSGIIEAEGLGSCNTLEKKFAKQDPYTILNSILKMGKKRALVDAVLSATRSSGIFTQDMEDIMGAEVPTAVEAPTPMPSRGGAPLKASGKTQQPHGAIPITPQQLAYIEKLVEKANLNANQVYTLFHSMFEVHSLRELTKAQASEFITLLKSTG